MSETFKDPERISTAAADALGGTTHGRTRIPFLADGVDMTSSPTLAQQDNRIQHDIRVGLAGIMNGMCRKSGTLKVVCNPFWYRKADGTAVHYEDGSTELTLTAAATNYVYLDHATNALAVDTSGWPADITTFTPLAIYVCGASDIETDDDDADVRGLVLYQTHASSTSPTGTTATAFTLDSDNAGAGADQQLRFNRGSTHAEDAALEWDEANDRVNAYKEHTAKTLCPVNASAVAISGTTMLDSDGAAKVAAAVAGDGLTHTAGVLTPNVDDATIEVDAGAHTLQLKAGGITTAKLGDTLADKLAQVSIGDAAGASPRTVTVQMKDIQGNDLAEVCLVQVGVYQDQYGAAEATDATIAVGGTGTLVKSVSANKVLVCRTDASGTLTLTITDAVAESVYVLAAPAPRSKILDCSDIGTVVIS